MNKSLQALIAGLDKGGKPPIAKLGRMVDSVRAEHEINAKDSAILKKAIKNAYNFGSYREVEEALGFFVEEYLDDFNPLLDKHGFNGWVRDYTEFTRNMEPPTAFHFATGMAILGGALQRNIWADWGYFNVYPLMNVFISGPAACGKNSAMDYGYKLGKDSGRIHFLPGKASEQFIHRRLGDRFKATGNADGMLYVPELSTFLGDQDWNRGLVTYLIDLLDGREDDERGTISRDSEPLENIAVSALVGTNEELLDRAVPKIALGGGFMSRFLIFYCSGTDRVCPRPFKPEGYDERELVTRLAQTQYIRGEVKLDKRADDWYEDWYRHIWKHSFPEDVKLVPTHKRNRVWIIRIAMVLKVSEMLADRARPVSGKDIIIEEKQMIQADALLDWIMGKLPDFFAPLGKTNFGKEQNKIITSLKRAGGRMAKKMLGRRMGISKRQLNDHLSILKEWGILEVEPLKEDGLATEMEVRLIPVRRR